jgi:hypothetical protein
MTYKDIKERIDEVEDKYWFLVLSPYKIQHLHQKLYHCVKNDKMLTTLHQDEGTVKIVVFQSNSKNSGISCAREQNGKLIEDYILCFDTGGNEGRVTRAHEIGHKLGLMHVWDPQDIMEENLSSFLHLDHTPPKKFRKWSMEQWTYIKENFEIA